MVGRKIAVAVTAVVARNGNTQPAAFTWKGIPFGICRIIREHVVDAENRSNVNSKVFYCETYSGPVHLYYLSGRWFINLEELGWARKKHSLR